MIKKLILKLNTYNIRLDLNTFIVYIFLANGKMELNRLIKKDCDKFNYNHNIEYTGIINYSNYKFKIPFIDEIKNYFKCTYYII
jgi:hypothetical protein